MKIVIDILVALIRVFLPAIIETATPTAEDGDKALDLRDTLRDRVRGTWGKVGIMLVLLLLLVGCAARTVYIPDGTPVRFREEVKKAKVWVLDKNGEPVATHMNIPEGWYALPVPEEPSQ